MQEARYDRDCERSPKKRLMPKKKKNILQRDKRRSVENSEVGQRKIKGKKRKKGDEIGKKMICGEHQLQNGKKKIKWWGESENRN